jgi:AraC-like DNA-binding protein
MSEICDLLRQLILVIERDGPAPLLYSSTSASTFANAPAPYLELAYLEEGSIPELRMGERTFAVPAGHLALVNVHFGNVAAPGARFRGRCVFFDLRPYPEFEHLAAAPWFACTRPLRPDQVVDSFDRLVARSRMTAWQAPAYPVPPTFFAQREDQRLSPTDALYLKAPLLELLAAALEAWGEAEPGRAALPPAAQAAVDMVHLDYADPALRLTDLAAAAHLDPSHFGRVFRRELGVTPMQYLRKVRLAHASALLTQTDLSVGQVAAACGFSTPFLFSRHFRAACGCSPTAYRRRRRRGTVTRRHD